MMKGNDVRVVFQLPRAVPKPIPDAKKTTPNPNVSKILPLTTFRTIDLEGNKNPGRLFSRFWTTEGGGGVRLLLSKLGPKRETR
jgi:hypothetical protein